MRHISRTLAGVTLGTALLAGAGGFTAGHITASTGNCTYGAASVANGDAVTSSVAGVDALCENGTMVRYVPSAR